MRSSGQISAPAAGCRPCRLELRAARRDRFTLIELLVAAALVVLIALLAYRFFANLQNVWQHSLGRTNTHEDARLALGLLARDLQTAVAHADDRPGFDIRFHQPSDTELWLVCDSAADSTVPCTLVEVGYRLREDRLERAFVDQSNAAWNIYGDRDDADDQGGYQTVIDGVSSLRFECYDDARQAMVPAQLSQLPTMVCITLSTMDARDRARWRALPADQRPTFEKQAARTFWRSVRLR
jgi:type II secretory pathway component PulJ